MLSISTTHLTPVACAMSVINECCSIYNCHYQKSAALFSSTENPVTKKCIPSPRLSIFFHFIWSVGFIMEFLHTFRNRFTEVYLISRCLKLSLTVPLNIKTRFQ